MADSSLLALFPLEVVLFPGMRLPLHIFEPRYRELVAECLERGEPFGVLLETGGETAEVGCSARIRQVLQRYPDGRLDILTEGERRFRVNGTDSERAFLRGQVEWLPEPDEDVADERRQVVELYRRTYWAHAQGIAPSQLEAASRLSFLVAGSGLFENRDRQRLLELDSERERLESLTARLRRAEPVVRRIGGNGHA